MVDILNIIKNGSGRIVPSNLGETFNELIDKDQPEYHLLIPNTVLLDKWSLEKFFQKYFIHELFDLSNCYLGSFNEPYAYWHVSKRKPAKIRVSIYYGFAHPYRDNDTSEKGLRVPDKFQQQYLDYIHVIEQWVKDNSVPNDVEHECEYKEISFSEYDITKPYARFYRKANSRLRELLRTAEIVPLRDFATVVMVTAVNGGNDVTRVKSLSSRQAPSYPYSPDIQAVDYIISTEKLHKDDIVELGRGKFFLIDKESDFDLYAPPGSSIIRAKSICPEFLYLYLNSQVAKRIRYEFKVPMGDYMSTNLGGPLEEFPVIKPKKDEKFYIEEFLRLSSPDKRIYIEQQEDCESESLEDALALELRERIKLNNDNLIKKQIDEDITELNTCYSNKAYKSTLILAGSIMEALLIDWLSEIRGKNYFEESLMKRVYDKEKKCYKTNASGDYIYHKNRYADLADYIDEIRDIKRPHWMVEADKAHEIRKKRNLVHAKLCLKESVEINDETCKEVINYLKTIIDSRWK